MDICTTSLFRYAMLHPETSLNTLATILPELATLSCTKHFVECRVTIGERNALIYAPITIHAMRYMAAATVLLNKIGYPYPRPQILPFELTTEGHNERNCSVIVEYIDSAESLPTACQRHSSEELCRALEELRKVFERLDISHNNLCIRNIVVTRDCRIIPLRPYYTTQGYCNDIASFTNLKEYIVANSRNALSLSTLHEPLSSYECSAERNPLIEGLRRKETDRGVGFENGEGEIVIECRYREASNFLEGRAMVTTFEGKMGLISTRGEELIPARYERVNYDIHSGNSWVLNDNKWALFDYFGLQITDWQEDEIYEIERNNYLSL